MTAPITAEELQKLVDAATPGPWMATSADHPEQGVYGCGYRIAKMTGGEIQRDRSNAALSALTPTLAAEVIRLRAQVAAADALAEAMETLRRYNVDIAAGRINYRPEDHIATAEVALSAYEAAK